MIRWEELTLKEKADMMKVAIRNGITNLKDIRQKYNEFAEGGNLYDEGGPKTKLTADGKTLYYSTVPETGEVRWIDFDDSKDFDGVTGYRFYDEKGNKMHYTPWQEAAESQEPEPTVEEADDYIRERGYDPNLTRPMWPLRNMREEGLQGVSPEFDLLLGGRGLLNGAVDATVDGINTVFTNPYVDAGLTSYFGAHGLNEVKNGNANAWTALEVMPLTRVGKAAIKEGPALIRDFNYWNPESMVNRNVRVNYANEKVPIGYNWKDPKNFTPLFKGIKQAVLGEHASLLPLDDVVARDFANTFKTEPFIRNSHVDFRKYLGLEDEHVLNSLVTEQPLSAYIPRKDGSFYVNLGNEENEMLLSNYSKNKGQGLYDTALGSHGGMGAKYENGVLHFEDVIDYQPFQSYKKLPGFIRKFEPSTIIPGAKPFKWSGDIRVSDYIDPALYERYIQQGIGEGPLVREATGKAYLPMSEEDFNARISKIVDDYLKSHPIGLK